MVSFCPLCKNILLTETNASGEFQFTCNICPIYFEIGTPIRFRTYCKLKQVDDVLRSDTAWENVDSTEARCPKCSCEKAYFMQIQTRSADEPMTTFYRCCNNECKHNWRD